MLIRVVIDIVRFGHRFLQQSKFQSFGSKSAISASSHMNSNPSQIVGIYKGMVVAVTRVNKPEVNLTRKDLVELYNVSRLSLSHHTLYCVTDGYFPIHSVSKCISLRFQTMFECFIRPQNRTLQCRKELFRTFHVFAI
jgi:hypothetical protein